MKVLIVLLTFLSLNKSSALEVDEKLTLRFLKVSNSKKTVLINRGAEDGLVVGDHAKFFVTSGVIARGVLEKASPSRSIWSLYRVVDPAEISDGKVLNLKIASPVKITDDSTKSTKAESVPSGSDKMGLKAEEEDAGNSSNMNEMDQKELAGMGLEETSKPAKNETQIKSNKSKEVANLEETPIHGGLNKSKNWEVWGLLNFDSRSGTESTTMGTGGATNSKSKTSSALDLTAGIEYYFLNSTSFVKDFSIFAFLNKTTGSSTLDTSKATTDWLKFGGGGYYHFYNPPASTNKIICFAGVSLGTGTGTVVISDGVNPDTSQKGSSTFVLGTLGLKYVLSNGFGMRASLEYYSASESYNYPNDVTVKDTYTGPRIAYGISYRF